MKTTLFNKLLNISLIEEMPMRASDIGDELYLHPDVKAQINKSSAEKDITKQPINEIIPPDFQAMLGSKRYRALVADLEAIFGANAPWATVMSQCMKAMGAIQQIELPQKKALERLAIDTVLSFPEWRIIKKVDVDKGFIKITAEIKTPNFKGSMDEYEKRIEKDEPEKVAKAEEETFNIIMDETNLKRNLANYITQGQSAIGFNTYKLIEKKLNDIDPKLFNLYKYFVVGGLVNYFAGPLNLISKTSAIGEVRIDYEKKDKCFHIRATGANFVLVVHEIIKGLYDYCAVDVGPDKLEALQDERLHTNIGPGIAKMFWDRFLSQAEGGVDDIPYFPLVLRVLYGCDPDVAEVDSLDLKEMLADRPRGLQLLKDIIIKVKENYLSWEKHENGDTESSNFNSDDNNDDDDDNGDAWKNG